MRLFENDFEKLKQDNIDESVLLKPEDYGTLDRMMTYLASHNVALFELEVMKKDLIGFAKEAEVAGITMEESLGMPEKEFCDSLLDGAMKKNFFDQVMPILRNMLMIVCLFHILDFMFSGCPKNFGLTISTVFFGVVLEFVLGMVEGKLIKRSVYGGYNANKAVYFIVSTALLALWFLMPDNVFVIRGNGWVIALVLAIIMLAGIVLNNVYWNRQSEKYKWE